MAAAGLMPVPEIQFRKYADPAAEQLNDCGTMRWRTANRFAAPMVVRIPGGFFKCGDPWHSQSNEVQWLARPRLARGDAVERPGRRRPAARGVARQRSDDLLRASIACSTAAGRGAPTPAMSSSCRSARPSRAARGRRDDRGELGRDGRALRTGDRTHREFGADLLDLRTLSPWDRDATWPRCARRGAVSSCTRTRSPQVSVRRSRQPLAKEAFFDLDAPIERLAMPDVPSPHSPRLLEAVLPSVESISRALTNLAEI